MIRGCYPGSFNPMTVAHLAIADAARRHCELDRLDLVLSEVTLGKEGTGAPSARERADALAGLLAQRPWLRVVVTEQRLLVDIADGYDWLVLGADKWTQVADPRWYGDSASARDDAVARLPRIAVAARPGHAVPAHGLLLNLGDDAESYAHVSSTATREGRHEWRAPGAL